MPKITVISIPLSSVVERVTSNDEVSRSSRLVGIIQFNLFSISIFCILERCLALSVSYLNHLLDTSTFWEYLIFGSRNTRLVVWAT